MDDCFFLRIDIEMTDEKTEIEKTSENPKDSKKDEDEKNKPKVPYFRLVSSVEISDILGP